MLRLNQLPQGKASGLNDAMEVAQGEIVVFTDARQKIEPGAVRLLVENFADPDVGCASGELMLGDIQRGGEQPGIEFVLADGKADSKTGGRLRLSRGGNRRTLCGSARVTHRVPPGTILDDVYLPMQVVRQGKRVVLDERARAWDNPNLGTTREFSRKVRTLGGNYQLLQLAPWLLSVRIRFALNSSVTSCCAAFPVGAGCVIGGVVCV